jgi:DNA sulfur modification protein DndD
MIIRKIQIENYLCYYGISTFELSEGLNIILGENGEGKTKFFEAIDWLFNGENSQLDKLVSAKKLEETELGDSFRVSVTMIVEQYGLKNIITKSFQAKKDKSNECSASIFHVEGIEENSLGERNQVDGIQLLDRIFPFQIRKYSMFKGEAELNIFNNEYALLNLINLFSDAKHYDKYTEKGAYLRKNAEKAVEDSSKMDKKNELLYKNLEREIILLEENKSKCNDVLNEIEAEIKAIEINLQDAENHVNNADALDILNKRIKELENKISYLNGRIDENYTTHLFDENWILVDFEDVHKIYTEKISFFSKKRREMQTEFDKQIGVKEGEKKAIQELLNKSIPLPIGTPSKAHMEEMLNDEICKVCNREAKKGSDAYEYMVERLNVYLQSQIANDIKTEDNKPLFQYNYLNRLENYSMSHEDNLKNIRILRSKINELFEFNANRKQDIEILKAQLELEQSERSKILGDSSKSEEGLKSTLSSYNTWQNNLRTQNEKSIKLNSSLKNFETEIKLKRAEKDKIDLNSANSFFVRTRNILRDIETIFSDTKEKKFDEFIEKLQIKSNNFFKKINIDAFTGSIIFKRSITGNKTIVDVNLHEEGRVFYRPNQSLLTSMHISILFAISELASEIKEENFPMIFDAPTSSFGESKTAQFLNLVYETKNQKILLLKDFIQRDESKVLFIKKEFEMIKRDKAFWVKLERPFDVNNLKTINTQVITI